MSGWNTEAMAAVLPDTNTEAGNARPVTDAVKPQDHGWVSKTGYDYDTYNKSTKELAEAQATGGGVDSQEIVGAVGGITPGAWAGNAAVYVWNDEYGDVGPAFPELEEQLFGSEFHVRSGIEFDKIATVEVHQEGSVRIKPILNFQDAGLHPVMLRNVELAGYNRPTPIQQYTIPSVIEGHDMVACAQTGSGKTAAFLIPILSKLMGKAKKLCAPRPNPATFQSGVTPGVRAEPLVLIVAPSRELATQIFDEARRFCYRTMFRPCVVYGGGPIGEQILQLQKGCDVLIGTPGRLCDFINRPHILTLKRLKYMVIDEADEMLNSDWETELKQIMSGGDQEEGNIKYLMFSATFPKIARDLATQHLAHDHVRVRVGRAGSSHVNIKQDVVFVEASAKRKALFDLLMSAPPARTIIFVNSKRTADEIDDYLFNLDIPCTSIHSDRTQREREDSIRAFRQGKAPVLIATGVSARGLDIHNVMHVINYDLPSTQYGGIEEYTHRIGRTGRIGNMGLATSFYNDKDSDIAETLVKTLLETRQTIPDFLEQYIPEGFTADGQGNLELLKFEVDSDDGEGEQNADGGDNGGGWGAAPDNSVAVAAQASAPAWGSAPDNSGGAVPPAPAWGSAPNNAGGAPAQNPTWGAPSTAAPTQPVTQNPGPAWGAPPSEAPFANPTTAQGQFGQPPDAQAPNSWVHPSGPQQPQPATQGPGNPSWSSAPTQQSQPAAQAPGNWAYPSVSQPPQPAIQGNPSWPSAPPQQLQNLQSAANAGWNAPTPVQAPQPANNAGWNVPAPAKPSQPANSAGWGAPTAGWGNSAAW